MNRFLGTVSALSLTALPAFAQEVIDLGTITVSAGLEETTPAETGVSVDVITEAELAETGEARVTDFLARQPGVTLRSNGPLGSLSGLSLRGVSQNNIAVRIDGIDVSDPSGTQVAFDFGSLLTSDISQIEIIRGAQSAIFGSEAFGGVINITTKRAAKEGSSVTAGVEFGSYGTARLSTTFANRGDGHETAVTLSHTASDGFSAADENDGNTEADGYEARRVSASGRYALGDGMVLALSGFAESARFDYDEGFGSTVFDGSPDEVTERSQTGLRAALEFGLGGLDNTLAVSRFRIDRTLTGSNGFGPFVFEYGGQRDSLTWQAGVDVGATGRLAFGLETVRETYEDAIFGATQDHETVINSAFAEYAVDASDALSFSLALRHDDHSEFGGYTTGRASALWTPRDDIRVRANLATGYRAPSNYELFDVFSGNADLTPETSRSADIGVEKLYAGGAYARATAFWVEAEDIIDYSFTTFGYVQRDGTATRKGIELAGGLPIGDRAFVDLAYTYTDSDADVTLDSSSWTTIVPTHTLAATVTADLTDRLGLAVTALYEADRAGGLDDYGVVNTTVSYGFAEGAEAYVRIENLFDTEYQTVPGYGQSDRAAFFGIRASF